MLIISIEVFVEQTERPYLQLSEKVYWYLQPMFEQISIHTGRDIVYCGRCVFPVEGLLALQQCVFVKKQETRQLKSSVITFFNGNIMGKSKNGRTSKKNNIVEVNKNEVLTFLTEVGNLIDVARQHSNKLYFEGN